MYGGVEALTQPRYLRQHTKVLCNALFWLVEEIAELADGPTGCDQLARDGCLFGCDFSVTRSTVLAAGGEKV